MPPAVKWWNYGLPPDWIFLSRTHAKLVLEISILSRDLFIRAFDIHHVDQYLRNAQRCDTAALMAKDYLGQR